jgi:hypothetical protein
MKTEANSARPGFDASVAGKRAECDGGHAIAGTHFVGRQEFGGTLTGDYFDHGDPPWRWYLLTQLTLKPEGYPEESVWCESESLFIFESEAGRSRPGIRLGPNRS